MTRPAGLASPPRSHAATIAIVGAIALADDGPAAAG
jgi:hypothetical protein